MVDTALSEHPVSSTGIVERRLVTDVRRGEDGWAVEVEDPRGVRLTYWVASTSCVPHVGDTALFYGGAGGQPIQGIAINNCRVFLDASAS